MPSWVPSAGVFLGEGRIDRLSDTNLGVRVQVPDAVVAGVLLPFVLMLSLLAAKTCPLLAR